jgi:hypothetical protein
VVEPARTVHGEGENELAPSPHCARVVPRCSERSVAVVAVRVRAIRLGVEPREALVEVTALEQRVRAACSRVDDTDHYVLVKVTCCPHALDVHPVVGSQSLETHMGDHSVGFSLKEIFGCDTNTT